MPIERERKFITSIDQAKQLTEGLIPTHLTQHYLSPAGVDHELRIRRAASEFTDPIFTTTLKQGHGEYRQETENLLAPTAYLALSALSHGAILKNRHALNLPGLTLDTYRSGPARLYGVLEIEQTEQTSDIGLFDPRSLGVGDITEVTGLPYFSNRYLATTIEQTEPTMTKTASLPEIYDQIESLPGKPAIITLGGPSGSGKTTILEQFHARYGDRCTTISTDDYYIGKTAMRTRMPEGHTTNFDHPAAIDTARLARDLASLRACQTIEKPLYDMLHSEPIGWSEAVAPNDIIIVEGLAANLPEIREHSDLTLALSAPVEERLRRRIERDTTRKGHAPEQTLDVFMNYVEPNYQTYFAPHDAEVDYQIDSHEAAS